jgi:hypothetical protein
MYPRHQIDIKYPNILNFILKFCALGFDFQITGKKSGISGVNFVASEKKSVW